MSRRVTPQSLLTAVGDARVVSVRALCVVCFSGRRALAPHAP